MLNKLSRAVSICCLLFRSSAFGQDDPHVKMSSAQKDSIRSEIARMLKDDQKYRWMIMYGELDENKIEEINKAGEATKIKRIQDARKNKVGISQVRKDSLDVLQERIDSMNFLALMGIVNTYGFPKKCAKMYEITTILLHVPGTLADDRFYATLLKEVKLDNLPAMEYARIYDRLHMGGNQRILYCVDEYYDDKTGKSMLPIPADIARTNEAWRKIGLPAYKQ